MLYATRGLPGNIGRPFLRSINLKGVLFVILRRAVAENATRNGMPTPAIAVPLLNLDASRQKTVETNAETANPTDPSKRTDALMTDLALQVRIQLTHHIVHGVAAAVIVPNH
jgi:hypothetical protein